MSVTNTSAPAYICTGQLDYGIAVVWSGSAVFFLTPAMMNAGTAGPA
jgi:hypothetical protein